MEIAYKIVSIHTYSIEELYFLLERFCYKTVGVKTPQTSNQDQSIQIIQMFKLITIPNCFIAIVTGCFSFVY